MPAKPKLKYTDLSLPNAYIKFVNAVADISLKNVEYDEQEELTPEDKRNGFIKEAERSLQLFDELGVKYHRKLWIGSRDGYLDFLTFNITNDGDVTFKLYEVVNPKLIPLFNTDFYGQISLGQFREIIDWCNEHKEDCKEIQTWLDYRHRM